MKITFLDRDTFPFYTQLVKPNFAHTWQEFPFTTSQQVVERAQDSDILIVNKIRLFSDVLQKLPKLKFVSLTATGYDNVDLDYCNKHNIKVSNVKNYGTASVVEHTFTLIFALLKNLNHYEATVKEGNWEKAQYFSIFPQKITELQQKTLGIIGPGTLGKRVADIASALGMNVLLSGQQNKNYPDIPYSTLALKELLPQVDILTLHLPLTPASKDLITFSEMQTMKKTSIIINTARGGIVNEEDLKKALVEKVIAGAGIDVLSEEPPTKGNPLLTLKDHPHLIITPHVAWGGENSVNNLMKKAIENIENFVKGTPTSLITQK